MEYCSFIKGNEIGSFVEMWMDLETVIQSEVSQKEENKYIYIYKCIYVKSEKISIANLIYKAEIETQRTNLWIPK